MVFNLWSSSFLGWASLILYLVGKVVEFFFAESMVWSHVFLGLCFSCFSNSWWCLHFLKKAFELTHRNTTITVGIGLLEVLVGLSHCEMYAITLSLNFNCRDGGNKGGSEEFHCYLFGLFIFIIIWISLGLRIKHHVSIKTDEFKLCLD